MFILFLIASFMLLAVGIYCTTKSGTTTPSLVALVIGLVFNVVAIVCAVGYGKGVGEINGLLESGKYEIATHDDYSLKELEEFKKVNNVYLKCIDEDTN